MVDLSTQAAYEEAFAVCGVAATVQRVSGFAPNVTVLAQASITAIVRNITADSTATASAGIGASQMGSIEQGDRTVIVMASDLSAAGFPLPVQRGDQVVLPDSSEVLNVLRVDPYKRALAGAIELTVVGVS